MITQWQLRLLFFITVPVLLLLLEWIQSSL